MEKEMGTGVLTVSDKAFQGKREDESGEVAANILKGAGYIILGKKIVPDDYRDIVNTLKEWVDVKKYSLVVTSGGTGLSPRDVTPQATVEVIDYKVPGIAEAMRAASLTKTSYAMLSRSVAGVRGSSLIINLPGSPKGVNENLSVILPALKHALSKLGGDTSDCATK